VSGPPSAGKAALVPGDPRASIAVDLGAESCRVSLLRWLPRDGRLHPEFRLVHRFPNGPVVAADGTLRWPLATILEGIDQGVRLCAELAPEGVRSIAVDGWAVDYVRLDNAGRPLEEPYCYRDNRAAAAMAALHEYVDPARLREIAGVEIQPLNTLYQLYADRLSGYSPRRWLNLPEYCLFRWGAEPVGEFTNASHTQLLEMFAGNWSREVFRLADLEIDCAPRIVPPGTMLGKLSGPLSNLPGLSETELIAPACHDTASAIAGIGETGDDWAYISCGTWSLVGTLLRQPLNSPSIREENFTNLGAVGGFTCFHKSVNGMWMLKQCMDHWARLGKPWELLELLEAGDREAPPADLLWVDDPSLLQIENMPARINDQRRSRGVAPLPEQSEAAPAFVSLLLHSLAARYAEVLDRIRAHAGKEIRRIVMVGGGAQNATLRRLTAEKTGLEVIQGPAESSTIGNFAVQTAVLEERLSTTSVEFASAVAAWAGVLHRA
jgi:rhamnulokinase